MDAAIDKSHGNKGRPPWYTKAIAEKDAALGEREREIAELVDGSLLLARLHQKLSDLVRAARRLAEASAQTEEADSVLLQELAPHVAELAAAALAEIPTDKD